MLRRIQENLFRQNRALEVLQHLLEEEFSLLKDRRPEAVSSLEFSMQELLRQLVSEREDLSGLLGGGPLLRYVEYIRADHPEEAEFITALLDAIDTKEQSNAKQAQRNTELVLALMDQSKSMLDYLYKQVVPQKKDGYSARGEYKEAKTGAHLIKGRL